MVVAVDLLFLVPGEVGGSETYVRRTLAAMARLHPEHRLLLVTNAENHDSFAALEAEHPGTVERLATGVRARSRLRRLLAEQVALPLRLRRRWRADALWCPGNLAPLACPVPVATTIHDMQYRHFPEDYAPAELLAMRFFTALSVRRSEVVVTVSGFSKAEILRFFPGFPEARVCVTPEAADPPGSGGGGAVAAGPRLLCVANTYPHKRVEDAVAAFGLLAGEFPALGLDLVGRPRRGEPAVAAAIAGLPGAVRARVRRVARLGAGELSAAYRGAAAVVSPSRYEGFGLPVLEALAAGAPVVACDAAATPEVAGGAARLVAPGDVPALAEAIRDVLRLGPEERRAVSKRGRRRAADFSWERTAEATFAALGRLAP